MPLMVKNVDARNKPLKLNSQTMLLALLGLHAQQVPSKHLPSYVMGYS